MLVYVKSSTSFTELMVQAVTRGGQYLNIYQAANLIITGKVRWDDHEVSKVNFEYDIDEHDLTINDDNIVVDVIMSEYEDD